MNSDRVPSGGMSFSLIFNSIGLSFLRKCSEESVSALVKPDLIL